MQWIVNRRACDDAGAAQTAQFEVPCLVCAFFGTSLGQIGMLKADGVSLLSYALNSVGVFGRVMACHSVLGELFILCPGYKKVLLIRS